MYQPTNSTIPNLRGPILHHRTKFQRSQAMLCLRPIVHHTYDNLYSPETEKPVAYREKKLN